MPEPQAPVRREQNALAREHHREAVSSAVFGAAFVAGAIAAAWSGLSLAWVGYLGIFGLIGIVHAVRGRRAAQQLSTLGLELRHGQRDQLYEVSIRLNPERSVRVTRVVAVLHGFATVPGPPIPESQSDSSHTERVLTLTEHLFDGSARLGHGEKLERTVAFQLPEKVNVPFARDKDPSLSWRLTILTEVDGQPFSEYDETAQVGLPVEYQVTLSQM